MPPDTMIDIEQLFKAKAFDWEYMIDCWSELGLPWPTEDEAKRVFQQLPHNIQAIAISWGCYDTVFRDEMLVYMRDTLKMGAKK